MGGVDRMVKDNRRVSIQTRCRNDDIPLMNKRIDVEEEERED